MRSRDDQSKQTFLKIIFYADISESREKQTPRHTQFRGQLMPRRFVGCGMFFPNHIASVFDLFSSNPEQLLKASNFSKSFATESVSHETGGVVCIL